MTRALGGCRPLNQRRLSGVVWPLFRRILDPYHQYHPANPPNNDLKRLSEIHPPSMPYTLLGAALLVLCAANPVAAGWWEVMSADAHLDMERARQAALDTVAKPPHSREAAAAAGWWLENLSNLADPGEMLRTAGHPQDPELVFLLGKIAAELHQIPPPGSLPERVISGPWGVFGRLDLDRDIVPSHAALPPVGTRWSGSESHFSYRLRSADGFATIPAALQMGGLTLSTWPVQLAFSVDGFLVVEATGSVNLEVDGVLVDRIRFPGGQDPGVSWYEVQLAAGLHRIRTTALPMDGSGARITLLTVDGQTPTVEITRSEEPGAPLADSTVTPFHHDSPPTRTDRPPFQELLLAAELARLRNDSPKLRDSIEAALASAPDEPMVHLAAAAFYLLERTDSAPEVDYRRAREHLARCASLPSALLLEHFLARRQDRREDADRLNDQLVRLQSTDPRVLRLRINQAVIRGWAREAEEALDELASMLGAVTAVDRLRLGVFEALERWEERRSLLRRLAEDDPQRGEWVGLLADECCTDLAIDLIRKLKERVVDPDLDADFVRLLAQANRHDEALNQLRLALEHWGHLPTFDALLPFLLRENGQPWKDNLREVLSRQPDNLSLRSLAWRHEVLEPFWRPYEVDAQAFAKTAETSEEGVDSVLLLDQAVERIFDDGSSLYYYHGLSKALTPAGARQVSVLEQMPGGHRIKLRIIKPDGSIVVPADISGNGANVVLGEVENGDLVEEEYVAAVAAIAPGVRGHLSPYVYRFADSDRNFGLSEYILVMSSNQKLQADGLFAGVEYSDEVKDGLRVMRWRARDVAALPNEPFAPPIQEFLPWVTYGFGVTWEDVGDSLRGRLIGALRSSRDLDSFAATHLESDDPVVGLRSFVAALFDHVEDGPGLLDLGSTAGVSFSRERGNRLGVLAGALVAAGWGVDVVLTRPAPYAGTHLLVPSTDVFTVPVLRVRRGEHKIWIDPRQDKAGVASLSPIIQGSDGLVLPLDDALSPVTFEPKLPSFPNPGLEDRTRIEATIHASGGAHLQYSTSLRDTQATRFNETLQSVPRDRISQVFDRLAVSIFPGAQAVVGSVEEGDQGLEVTLDLEIADACDRTETTFSCRALVTNQPLAPVLASLPARQLPLVLQLPILRRHETVIHPPRGSSIDFTERKLSSRWGKVEEHIEQTDDTVRSIVTLQVYATRVAPDDYAEFARFCRAIDELLGRPPVFAQQH